MGTDISIWWICPDICRDLARKIRSNREFLRKKIHFDIRCILKPGAGWVLIRRSCAITRVIRAILFQRIPTKPSSMIKVFQKLARLLTRKPFKLSQKYNEICCGDQTFLNSILIENYILNQHNTLITVTVTVKFWNLTID